MLIEVLERRVERNGEIVNEWSEVEYRLEIPHKLFSPYTSILLNDFMETYLEYSPRSYYSGCFDYLKLQYLKEIKDIYPYASLNLSVKKKIYELEFPGPKKKLLNEETNVNLLKESGEILDSIFSLNRFDTFDKISLFERTPYWRYKQRLSPHLENLFEAIDLYRKAPDRVVIENSSNSVFSKNRKRIPEIILGHLSFRGKLNATLAKECKIVYIENNTHLLYLYGFMLDPDELEFNPMHEYLHLDIVHIENGNKYTDRFANGIGDPEVYVSACGLEDVEEILSTQKIIDMVKESFEQVKDKFVYGINNVVEYDDSVDKILYFFKLLDLKVTPCVWGSRSNISEYALKIKTKILKRRMNGENIDDVDEILDVELDMSDLTSLTFISPYCSLETISKEIVTRVRKSLEEKLFKESEDENQ